MKNNKIYVMAEAAADGGAGGGDTALTKVPKVDPGNNNPAGGGANSDPKVNANGGDSKGFNLPENWQASLADEDLKNDPTLKSIKDINSFAKMLVHAQKAVGADKVPIPGKHATDADWKEFYKKVGAVPESLEKYDVKVPEIFNQDKEGLNQLKQAAYEANISPKQFEKLADIYGKQITEGLTKQKSLAKQDRDVLVNGLKVEWGKAFDQNLATAVRAVEKTGDDSLKKLLDSTGLGDHPAIIKAFFKVGQAFGEDQIIKGQGADGQRLYAPAEAKIKVNEILANHQHPYYDGAHPNHGAAVKEVQELFNMVHPS